MQRCTTATAVQPTPLGRLRQCRSAVPRLPVHIQAPASSRVRSLRRASDCCTNTFLRASAVVPKDAQRYAARRFRIEPYKHMVRTVWLSGWIRYVFDLRRRSCSVMCLHTKAIRARLANDLGEDSQGLMAFV